MRCGRLVVGAALVTAMVAAGLADQGDEPQPLQVRPMPIGPLGPIGPGPAKPVNLFAAANRGALVFVATLVDAKALMQTASMPPTIGMQVTFDKVEVLKGEKPDNLTFRYNYVEGQGFNPPVGRQYVVVAGASYPNQPFAVTTIVEATEANVKTARQAVRLPLGWSLDEAQRPVSPWSVLGDKAWPKEAADPALGSDVKCVTTGRPALLAGTGVTLAVEQVPPKVKQPYRNPYGDGEFTVTVTNTTDKPVDVPALLTDGTKVLWADSLFVIERDTVRLLPGAGGLAKGVKPVHLEPGRSVATVINALTIRGVSWPGGGSRVSFLFCLGELSATNFFYYFSAHHDPLRQKALKAASE